jgi:hypothetical protein
VQSLDQWKRETEMKLKLDLDSKLLSMRHNLESQFLEQKKELADFTINRSQEDRINKLEAKVDADNARMSAQIQVTSVILVHILPTDML